MNIFVLDTDPELCAQMHCDKHVIKMMLESAQMISTTLAECGLTAPYKVTHRNHPCTLWTRRSAQNYKWLKTLTYFLNKEFKFRFSGRDHKSWLAIKEGPDPVLPDKGLTEFTQAMPDHYKDNDPVTAYRNYYIGDKAHFAVWKKRPTPNWFVKEIR